MKSRVYIIAASIPICFITAFLLIICLCSPHTAVAIGNETAEDNSAPGIEASNGSIEQSDNGTNSNETDKTLSKDSNPKVAYLTFDDGPSNLTPELLNTLESCNVHATFFVVGLNAEQYPDTLKQMVSDGDVIGIHSWTHKYSYIYKNTQNFLDDFDKLDNYIKQTTGVTPNICRFPGGTNNTVCFSYNKKHIMKSIVPLVENMGFTYYDWNVSSGESNTNPPSKDQITSSVVSQCKGKNTAVILFHDTDHQSYVDAIPEIVSELSSMGFSFDTLSPEDPPSSKASATQFKPS